MARKNKGVYEAFAKFFDRPTVDTLRELIRRGVGETDHCDFKRDWPSFADTARHVLAMANSGGGVIIVGVSQGKSGEFTSDGIKQLVDKADIAKRLGKLVPALLEYDVLDFAFTDSEHKDLNGKSFQVMIVESDPKHIPYQAVKDGDGLRANAVYVRRGTESKEASHDELERLINTRVESGYSSRSVLELEEHLEQLKTLYSEIPRYNQQLTAFASIATQMQEVLGSMVSSDPNPLYPAETYEEFIAGLIPRKKQKVEQVLELTDGRVRTMGSSGRR